MKITITKIASLALFAAVSVSSAVEAGDKVLLKTQLAFGSNLPVVGTGIKYFSKQVQDMSGKTVNFKLYEPNKLVAPFEILDAVSTGKLHAGFGVSGYWAGKIPAANLFTAVPFGPEAGEYLAWMYYGNGMKLYQKMYDDAGYNVKAIPCVLNAPETAGWYPKPIEKPEDLKGLKARYFGLGGKVLSKLGVSVSLLPAGEIFPALEKKAIDATEFSIPTIDTLLGFHKVVKYNYFPGWHQQATLNELLINGDTWKKLDEAQQSIVLNGCKSTMTYSFAEGEATQFDVMQENVEKNGVKIMRWNDEMLAAFKGAWDEVAAEESANDAGFKEVYDDLIKFRKGYAIWKENAFLPR